MENKIWNAVEGFDPNDSLICYRKTEKNADGTARLMDTALCTNGFCVAILMVLF